MGKFSIPAGVSLQDLLQTRRLHAAEVPAAVTDVTLDAYSAIRFTTVGAVGTGPYPNPIDVAFLTSASTEELSSLRTALKLSGPDATDKAAGLAALAAFSKFLTESAVDVTPAQCANWSTLTAWIASTRAVASSAGDIKAAGAAVMAAIATQVAASTGPALTPSTRPGASADIEFSVRNVAHQCMDPLNEHLSLEAHCPKVWSSRFDPVSVLGTVSHAYGPGFPALTGATPVDDARATAYCADPYSGFEDEFWRWITSNADDVISKLIAAFPPAANSLPKGKASSSQSDMVTIAAAIVTGQKQMLRQLDASAKSQTK